MTLDKLELSVRLDTAFFNEALDKIIDERWSKYDEAFMRGVIFALGAAMEAQQDTDEVSVMDIVKRAGAWLKIREGK